ncbi:MAG: type II toxin-antitoxin system RelE/ParE family toxin [Planctomycetota bacterium]|nr:type II toxin-antitoxin system RelE/ParE family toxin [Planctomycetota bacterium]
MLPRAIAELRSIVLWWSDHHSTEQAGRWLIGMEAAIAGHSNDSDPHRQAFEADSFPFEVRELHFGIKRRKTHRVVFAIRDDVVRVYSIRHLAQDTLTADDLGLH